MKKLLCFILGHKPVKEQKKDMFGYGYVWQKVYCKRCYKRLN